METQEPDVVPSEASSLMGSSATMETQPQDAVHVHAETGSLFEDGPVLASSAETEIVQRRKYPQK
jgi:hypothetical protein